MILICPSCDSRYLVPATVFATGPRQVRCARCAHSWQADLPPEEMNAATRAVTDVVETPNIIPPIPAGSNVPAIRRSFPWRQYRRQIYSGAGCLLAFIALLWLILDRQYIVNRAYWMEGFYNVLGLSLDRVDDGLVIQQVHSERRYEDGTMRLVVEGEIRNIAPRILQVPDIEVKALGSDGKEMRSWKIDAPQATLAAGAVIPFHTSVTTPEGTVAEVNLSFIGLRHDHD